MSGKTLEEDTHSFIIRIWETAEDQVSNSDATWRGSIDYVGSGKRLYFNDLNSIARFIREQIHADGLQGVDRWEALVERRRLGRRFRSFWRLLSSLRLKNLLYRKPSAHGQGHKP
jgi:hypothetical protein